MALLRQIKGGRFEVLGMKYLISTITSKFKFKKRTAREQRIAGKCTFEFAKI